MSDKFKVQRPDDFRDITEMFNFACRTNNPLMMLAAEKWAGAAGYEMDSNLLRQYMLAKDCMKRDPGKIGSLLTLTCSSTGEVPRRTEQL